MLAGIGATVWQLQRANSADYRLRRGQDAIHRGDISRAEHSALRLEAAGDLNHAHLLRGEIALQRDDLADAIAHYNGMRGNGELRLEASALYGQWFLLRLHRPREGE